ncbi:MAG: Unknown protein [uncultured Thiotrichaceae bacterium]|uniref:Phosphate-selective porin O and P n=1 Tax=uncultured Thiotrichaceae bacterium TaxID=298394 RepID=A0A6S6T737_9GAMM|nr:MAG: Unknown protein [uncultured Thiotrichaceae bacterium]
MKPSATYASLFSVAFSLLFSPVLAEDNGRNYTTRDEKREAAQRYKITKWFSLSTLAEIEQSKQRFTSVENEHSKQDDFSKSLDVELFFNPSKYLTSEVTIGFDDDKGKLSVDEAVVIIDLDPMELELGKLYLPVGEYYSHFITGAPTEFSETQAKAAVLNYQATEKVELALFVYDGDAEKQSSSNNIDWGVSTELQALEGLTLGLGYQSDLADADEVDLQESRNQYARRVDGIGMYGAYEFGDVEITAEYTGALKPFNEFDEDRNKPAAWNMEFAHYPRETFEWALRLAGSHEIEDAPEKQLGIVATWHLHKQVSASLEYLHNDYKAELAEDQNEEELRESDQFGGRLTLLF